MNYDDGLAKKMFTSAIFYTYIASFLYTYKSVIDKKLISWFLRKILFEPNWGLKFGESISESSKNSSAR